jgi:hypothetical protein
MRTRAIHDDFKTGHPKMKLRGRFAMGISLLASVMLLTQCSEDGFIPDVDIETPGSITIVSGNNQYSMHGTEVLDPLVVEVKSEKGQVLAGVEVAFKVLVGGGGVSAAAVLTNSRGRASTAFTLGPNNGLNQARASVVSDVSLSALFEATASDFLCPEAEDNLQICVNCPTGYNEPLVFLSLFLATGRSEEYPGGAGIVRINVAGEVAEGFTRIPPVGIFQPVVWDGAFSPRGDYYISRGMVYGEIVKIDVNGNLSTFARIDSALLDGAIELAHNPLGLLVGCDARGPFLVRCRDTANQQPPLPGKIVRFSQAKYTDEINNDALAVDPRRHDDDPLGEDIYFINKSDRWLYRLPMDSLEVEPQGLERVVSLTADQATWARGMVCDDRDGSVYILVDTDDTKELLKVTPGQGVSQLYDFFSRGGGTKQAAGEQRDLAFKNPNLFTLDTLNDKLLVYDVDTQVFRTPLFSDSLEQAKISKPNSPPAERVGLDVLR